MINRSAIILKYKEPFVRWINEADPYDHDIALSLKEANEDRNVYLITEEGGEDFEKWISLNYKKLFEIELNDWYTDESLWPEKRNKKTFNEWFSVGAFQKSRSVKARTSGQT